MIPDFNDTIAGIATAPGEAGISIIRISGEKAISIAGQIFKSKRHHSISDIKDRTLTYGWIEIDNTSVDEVLLCIMKKPHSFTVEDVVEVHCHGGSFITNRILNAVLNRGARLANAGEFTQRAFLNGRIDLTQAEATNDMIKAQSDLNLNMVVNQLKGKLYEKISTIKEEVSWILSLVNAGIDFPEEDTVFSNINQIRDRIRTIEHELKRLIHSADTGIKIREGYKIVLAGKPNVGKSKILNGLLEESRSIVNQAPGTTRDTIEESCSIHGIPASLIDTAGIHETGDEVEREGIERAFVAIKKADLILWVIDLANPSFTIELADIVDISNIPILLVLNKRDLVNSSSITIPDQWQNNDQIVISALKEEDIDHLRKKIFDFISGRKGRLVEETMLTNIRQKLSAQNALETLYKAKESLESGIGEELLAIDLTQMLSALGEIVGETTPDDMLNKIFEEFCIGK
ncbi:tRNA uridine-5-carboxymethylaminomethyl(34) synthesis GTPase MnmE [bacterium]|nr:tRNA uridine-5-carboxymethylaminomethyl(34) synthesis GTPase MnmE [bacterium]